MESTTPLSPYPLDADALKARVHDPLPHPDGVTRQERAGALTQSMADAFARGIRAHPADWHMMQRLWLSDLPRRAAA